MKDRSIDCTNTDARYDTKHQLISNLDARVYYYGATTEIRALVMRYLFVPTLDNRERSRLEVIGKSIVPMQSKPTNNIPATRAKRDAMRVCLSKARYLGE